MSFFAGALRTLRMPKRSLAQLAGPGLHRTPFPPQGMVAASQSLRGPWFQATDFSLVRPPLFPFTLAAVDFPTFTTASIIDAFDTPALPKGDAADDSADVPVLAIKRTFQPSTQRKKRRAGFLIRNSTTHGRLTLKNRRAKGRARLAI